MRRLGGQRRVARAGALLGACLLAGCGAGTTPASPAPRVRTYRNLIRAQSPPALYAAVRRVANDAAADVRAGNASARLSVSVQVDWAWGYGSDGAFQGAATDFADFPFIQEWGCRRIPTWPRSRRPN